jgi:hypothetical protein
MGEGVGRPADIGANEDLAVEVGLRELLQGSLQDLEVIGSGVRAGVAGSKQGGEGLVRLVEIAEQGVKAEAALVVAGGVLHLGVGGDQGGVDVEGDLIGTGAGVPDPRPGLGAGGSDLGQKLGVDRLDDPVGGALGGDLAEEDLLAEQDAEVGDAVAAVGDRDGEVAQDDSRIVSGAALAGGRHRARERLGEAGAVGELGDQKRPRVGDQSLTVRRDFYRSPPGSCFTIWVSSWVWE